MRATNKSIPPTSKPVITIPVPEQTVAIHKEKEKEDGELSSGSSSPTKKGKEKAAPVQAVEENWVKKTSKGGNMSLMTVHKR